MDDFQFWRSGFSSSPSQPSQPRGRWLVAMVTSLNFVIGVTSASAFPRFDLVTEEDYQICAENLQDLGLSADLVAEACAAVIRPENLSQCVTQINQETAIAPEAVLASCVSVRRPEELATCVIDITQASGADPANVLNSCRRSLLPERHSFCVLGLTQGGGIAVDQALETCLNPPEQFFDLGVSKP